MSHVEVKRFATEDYFLKIMTTKKKILVTGGAGYIGSALVPALLARGYEVRVFDKLVFGDFGLDEVKGKIEIIQGDVKDPPANLMNGIYGVVHLAGFSTEPTSHFNPRHTDQVNHLGTENIARLAKSAGIERFSFASSCSVYFTYDTALVPPFFKEDEMVNCISPYSITKRAAEEALLELTDANFRPVIFRKGTLYGFAPKMRYDLILNGFTKDAFKSGTITVVSGGNIYRPMLDIKDAVAAYIAALELPLEKIGGKIFNVAYWNCHLGELANEVRGIIKDVWQKNVKVDVKEIGVTRNYRADNTKYESTFGLASFRSPKAAIAELWEKLENGHNTDDIRFYTDRWYREYEAANVAQKTTTS